MPAPFLNHLFPDSASHRAIDNQFHLERIANSADEIEKFEAERFELQREAAVETLSRLSAIAELQSEANELLGALTRSSVAANRQMQRLTHLSAGTLSAVQQGFGTIAAYMLDQRQLLEESVAVLRQPYDTQVQELLREASRALDAGMLVTGKEREAEFADATTLISAALANPIGARDCVAWFQHGWLLWRDKTKLDEAEGAFYHAARLSKGKSELYHLKSIRHQALMQYLQAKYGDAYKTISSALALTSEYEVIMEAARYAARTNHEKVALELLERGIAMRPETIGTIFGEPDFAALNTEMLHLATRKTSEARLAAVASIERWRSALNCAAEAEQRAGLSIPLSGWGVDEAARCAEAVTRGSYVDTLIVDAKARPAADGISKSIQRVLENEAERIKTSIQDGHRRVEQAKSRYETIARDGAARLAAEESRTKERLQSLEAPTFWGGVVIGAGYGVMAFIASLVVLLVGGLAGLNGWKLDLLLLPFIVCTLLGWLIVPLYNSFKRAPRRSEIRSELAKHRARIESETATSAAVVQSGLQELQDLERSAQATLPRILSTADWLRSRPPG